jgi:hypothetical protein
MRGGAVVAKVDETAWKVRKKVNSLFGTFSSGKRQMKKSYGRKEV